MRINFTTLTLQCRKSREVLDLSHQITFFHGKVSSGKSSIARLIDFCLGGDFERTPALIQELVSATLEANIGTNHALLERDADSNQIRVTWVDDNSNTATVLAPIQADKKPIWAENIFSLSDLIFHLVGMNPLLIASNKNIDEARISRLSFRNFMWYSYLDQHHLDSSFYRLEDSMKQRNSREVMKFVMQYSNQALVDLEAQLIKNREERQTKIATAKELKSFLAKFGYSSIEEIEKEIGQTTKRLKEAEAERKNMESGYVKDTHFSDDVRDQIRKVALEISEDDDSIDEIERRLSEQEALRSELISTKFKLARTESVSNILSGVKFDSCPQCGTSVAKRKLVEEACSLCTSPISDSIKGVNVDNAEILRLDIDSRVKDIEASIATHKTAVVRHRQKIARRIEHKRSLDEQLSLQLKTYESSFLANIREVDRKVATYRERLKSQNKLKEMPQEITKLEARADELIGIEQRIKRDIQLERDKLTEAENNVIELERVFLETLTTVGLPGISEDDEIHINRKTWEVFVYPNGHEFKKWNFSNAGSGGKKTLFNVCYLLSLHIVSETNKLMLPSFIVIDTPMKNIDKEVNEDLFKRFYDYLFLVAKTELDQTQIILIDNSFIIPNDEQLSFFHRYMTDGDDDNPPLISYYRGA